MENNFLQGDVFVEHLKHLIKTDWTEVFFVKMNGEERYMVCTQKPELFMHDKNHVEVKDPSNEVTSDQVRVFEQDTGWRSFNINRVLKFNPVLRHKN